MSLKFSIWDSPKSHGVCAWAGALGVSGMRALWSSVGCASWRTRSMCIWQSDWATLLADSGISFLTLCSVSPASTAGTQSPNHIEEVCSRRHRLEGRLGESWLETAMSCSEMEMDDRAGDG